MTLGRQRLNSITLYNLNISSIGKDIPWWLSSTSLKRPHSGTFNQPLLCQVPKNKLLDSMWHTWGKCGAMTGPIAYDDLKTNIFKKWGRWYLMRQLLKISWLGLLKVCHKTFDDDIILQMISSVYDLDDICSLEKNKLKSSSFQPSFLPEFDL